MQSNIVEKTAKYFKEKGIVLPTISELRNPHLISDAIKSFCLNCLNIFKDSINIS